MSKKKVLAISIFLIVVVAALLFLASNINGYTVTDTNGLTWYFNISGNNAVDVYLYSGSVSSSTLEIPRTLNYNGTNYTVTSIRGYSTSTSSRTNILRNTYNYSVKKVIIPDTVTNIGVNTFAYFEGLQEVVVKDASGNTTKGLPQGVTTIGANAFYYCYNLKEIEIPNLVTTIGDYAFYYAYNLSNVKFGTGLKTIGANAFYYCYLLETISLPESLQTIGNYAFQSCYGLRGDLIIPDNVTSLGASAFYGCSGLNGTIKIGNKVQTINSNTFYGCADIKKVIIGSGITSINSNAFIGISDLWIKSTKDKVTINSNIDGLGNRVRIHWGEQCTHKINISVPEDVKIVNADTNKEIVSNSFECGSNIAYKIINNGKSDNLVLTIVENNEYDNPKTVQVEEDEVYEIVDLLTDVDIMVHDIANDSDLVLRNYISEVNREELSTSREPKAVIENGKFEYKHTKYPVIAKTGDMITYTIRIYNEGSKDGKADEISVYIPEGLKFVEDNKTNQKYGWDEADGKISTEYLKGVEIDGYNGILEYKDVELVLEVTEKMSTKEDKRMVVMAEISKQSIKDADSTPGNVEKVDNDYKKKKSYESTTNSYIKGFEDDDDFENILLVGKIKVDYSIKINKIDSETGELLVGAKFNLLDSKGKVIKTTETTKDGTLDFGILTTYGEGEDIYYIEEVNAPEGYTVLERNKIKVEVIKTIENPETREYSVKVNCDVLDYTVDTTRHEYIPVYNKEQLAKIGSGETITIDGVDYKYNPNSKYKLMADIDLEGEQWTPIQYEIKGIINGDGYRISNLTIISDETMNIAEIGLFRSFSGIIENLELENVRIEILSIDEEAESLSGYTGIGAFAGYMKEGTIRNCTVSGIIKATSDNIGGFVGHTEKEAIVKIQNSVNNLDIVGEKIELEEETLMSSNVGGFIGCALGAVSITDCTNNGYISGTGYNTAGFVGYVESTDYRELNIKADFSEEDKMITLVVENNRTSGKYAIELENMDAQTLGLIEGAKYKILDRNKNVISGLEEVELTSGSLRVATVDITTLGVDTYYIKEIKSAEGYDKQTGTIKLEVRRYWDTEKEEFKVSVNAENLADEVVATDKAKDEVTPSNSGTGEVFVKVDFENIAWKVNKAVIKNSVNNGTIKAYNTNGAGFIGASNCSLELRECVNKGEIQGWTHSAGFIAEIKKYNDNTIAEIYDCSNEGNITFNKEATWRSDLSGIVGYTLATTVLDGCENKRDIKYEDGNVQNIAGLVSNSNENLTINNCSNSGDIEIPNATNIGGLVAQNYNYEAIIEINNVVNTGNMIGTNASRVAGIITHAQCKELNIDKVRVYGKEKKPIVIQGGPYSYTGGIVTWSKATTEITNSQVMNVKMISGYTLGGIIGEIAYTTPVSADNKFEAIIRNCKVQNIEINNGSDTTILDFGGIVAKESNSNMRSIKILDCTVENITMPETIRLGYAGGLAGFILYPRNIEIENNTVKNSKIYNTNSASGSGTGMAGMIGRVILASEKGEFNIKDCDFENSSINAVASDSISGIIGSVCNGSSYYDFNIENCNVVDSQLISTGYSTTMAGILANTVSAPDIKIDNCNVINTEITAKSSSNMSGMIAISTGGVEISNCKVENSDITGTPTNIGGFLGATIASSDKKVELTNCEFIDGSVNGVVTTETGYSSTTNSGILVGLSSYVNVQIKDCKVIGKNETIKISGGAQAGGLVGCATGTANTVNNVVVKNIEVEEKASGGHSSAGFAIANHITIKDIDVSDAKLIGPYAAGGVVSVAIGTVKLENADVKNIEIESSSNGASLGGVIGLFGNSSYSIASKVNKINVDNIKIETTEGHAHAGGVIGCGALTLTNATVKNIDITNNTRSGVTGGIIAIANANYVLQDVELENVELEGKLHTAGAVGIGYGAGRVEDIDIKNVDIIVTSDSSNTTSPMVSPAIAYQNNGSIKNVNVNKSNITYAEDGYYCTIGGLVGNSLAKMDDCQITDFTVNVGNNELDYNMVGGIAGISNSPINNVTVNDVNINVESRGARVAGGVAILSGKIENVNIENANLILKAQRTLGLIAGGIAGGSSGYIKDVKVENLNIDTENAQYLGGIVGVQSGDIDNAKVISSEINNDNIGAAVGGIVGVTSYTASEIANCTVSDTSVTNGENSYTIDTTFGVREYDGGTGGIAGYANNTIKKCTLENSTVSSTDENSYAIGGIVGHGSNFEDKETYVTECTVKNSVIEGTEAVGGIAGVAVPYIEDCLVEGEEVISETTGEMSNTNAIVIEEVEVNNEEEIEEVAEVVEEKDEEITEMTEDEQVAEIEEEIEATDEEKVEETTKVIEETKEEAVQTLAQGETTKEYSTKIIGTRFVGGIVGLGGQLVDNTYGTNTFVSITDCKIKGIQMTGNEYVAESIGRNSYYNETETTIYDRVVNLIKEAISMIVVQ